MQIAIIGCGKMGGIYASKMQVEKLHCFDCDPAKTLANAQRTDSLESILTNKDIGAVVIAASTGAHYELARKCLLHGKHVLLEKPVSLKTEQANVLAALAKERGCVLQPCHQLVLNKQFAALCNAIHKAPAYRISHIKAFRHYPAAVDRLPAQPPLISDEGPHALSVVFEALRAGGQLGQITLKSCTEANNESGKNTVSAAFVSEREGGAPAVSVQLDFSKDSTRAARETGIKIALQGPDGYSAEIFWNEAAGKIEVTPPDSVFASLADTPLDPDPLATLVEGFLAAARAPRAAKKHPALSGDAAAAITSVQAGLEQIAGGLARSLIIRPAAMGRGMP